MIFGDYFPDYLGVTIGGGLSLALYLAIKAQNEFIKTLEETIEEPVSAALVEKAAATSSGIAACIWGTVRSISKPIYSTQRDDITGVVWKHTLREHVMAQVLGLWTNNERTLNVSSREVPFFLEDKGIAVEISNPARLDSIDMVVVRQKFQAANSTLVSTLWGWARGVQPTGTQEIEEMLLEGTKVLGVGKLVMQNEQLFLQPHDTLPYLITTNNKDYLVSSFTSQQNILHLLTILSTAVTVFCTYRICSRFYTNYMEFLKKRAEKRDIDEARQRRELQEDGLPESLMCVVCFGLRDVVLLPCQHVCICGECSLRLNPRKCPVCRKDIENIKPVFYS